MRSERSDKKIGLVPVIRWVRQGVAVIAGVMLCGCETTQWGKTHHTYWGEKRSDSETAFIQAFDRYYLFTISMVRIIEVDSVGCEEKGKIRVLPGEHEIKVRSLRSTGQTVSSPVEGSLYVSVEAGGRYKLQHHKRGNYVFIWIKDEKTGEIVGGNPNGDGLRIKDRVW